MNNANTRGSPPKGAQVTPSGVCSFHLRGFATLISQVLAHRQPRASRVRVYIPHASKVNGNVVPRQIFPIKTLPKADV